MTEGKETVMTVNELRDYIRDMSDDEILRITFEAPAEGKENDDREHETETV